jgi:cytoskeletal protein CcmA (bactofilin family)
MTPSWRGGPSLARFSEDPMLNFNRNDRPADTKDSKPGTRPATPGAQPPAATPAPTPPPARTQALPPVHHAPGEYHSAPSENAGSKLSIGPNINLKGVEISNCDVLVIEGNVDATITSKVMEIAKPGRFTGTANIDIAEIHGDFQGELTARAKLVVHGTGRVTGTVRYGKLVVAEGGIVNGEVKQLDSPADSTAASTASTTSAAPATPSMPRPLLNPQPH